MKAVADSNIFFSAFCYPRGAARQVLRLVEENKIRLGVPKYCILELEPVFRDKGREEDYVQFIGWVSDYAEEITIPRGKTLNRYKDFARDVWDVPIIASAIEWGAEYFITGNSDDFDMDKVGRHLQLVTIRQVLEMFAAPQEQESR